MNRYDYKSVVKAIYTLFNNNFQTNYKIIYQDIDSVKSLNPSINIGKSAGGFYDAETKSIYILSNVVDEINEKNYKNLNNNNDNGLAFLIQACFHELEHRLQIECPQKLRKQTSFAKTMYDIEKLVIMCDKEFYKQNHDTFYMEIDADTKGVENATLFINLYKMDGISKEYYDALRCYHKYRSINYDIPQFIVRLNKIVKMFPQVLSDNRYINNEQVLSFYDKKNGEFKPIEEIMKDTNVLTPYIVSSEMFLKSIDMDSINLEQCQFLIKNLMFVMAEHKAKKNNLNQLYSQAQTACEQLDKYTHVSNTPSRRTIKPMADENYYQFIENNIQLISNMITKKDEHELQN